MEKTGLSRARFLAACACSFWVLLASSGCTDSPYPGTVLRTGGLARLPASATGVKTHSWRGFGGGELYLMFQATSEDISIFVDSSPGLNDLAPANFGPGHRYLPEGHPEARRDDETYSVSSADPVWFRPTIMKQGRAYFVPAERTDDHAWAKVIIDDEQNIVYVRVAD